MKGSIQSNLLRAPEGCAMRSIEGKIGRCNPFASIAPSNLASSPMKTIAANDLVIYRQAEASAHPIRGAQDVRPARHGEFYTYVVEHYWRVVRVLSDGTLEAISRSGSMHRIGSKDPMLSRAPWWCRLGRRAQFPGS